MRVCVVGAGTSGLAAIRGLRRAGHEVRAYEAAAGIGGMWRYGDTAAYASLRTNTSRRRMQYPSLAIGRSVAEFPHHSEMLAYLERYAEANGLASSIELATRVQRARLGPDGGWEVELADRQGAPERFDALVVASGHYRDPEIPSLPGRFAGEIRHVRDYDAPEPYWGRRVVVLGAGQSALDIAAEVATVAERVTLSCRQGHHLVPRRVLGRPLDEFDRSTALLLPPAAVRALLELLIRAGRATPPRGGFPLAAHPLLQTRWPVVVSPALQAALEEGAIHHRPRIAALEADHVRFEDGTSE
ncbi:MAG TPA: FAD-dependent oxidoreductase, partial [Solirubrobacteraceae bacterium]|nr:FAD-dependent oxidoreductase [Solirubrobacteraceae bacterium]